MKVKFTTSISIVLQTFSFCFLTLLLTQPCLSGYFRCVIRRVTVALTLNVSEHVSVEYILSTSSLILNMSTSIFRPQKAETQSVFPVLT